MEVKRTFVFVPGGWHGGWAFDPVTERLQKQGCECYSLTLPGLELDTQRHNQIINLTTHVEFVVDFLVMHDLRNVILCGHSYAGLVITGVADRITDRIGALVYIDAYVPRDGDSCWSLTTDMYRDRFVTGAGEDGYLVAVGSGGNKDERRRPHPLATFLERIRLKGDHERITNRTFVFLAGWNGTPFTRQYESLKNSAGWRVETIDSEHDVMKHHPDKLVEILSGIL